VHDTFIETCDDNNTVNGDGCDSTCHIEANFTCFQNSTFTVSVCSRCGDKKIEGNCDCISSSDLLKGTETCDDGNSVSGDGCSSTCQIEYGYSCNFTNATGSICFQVCGNGERTVGEQVSHLAGIFVLNFHSV
jgi:cysteine-rich repeat protein